MAPRKNGEGSPILLLLIYIVIFAGFYYVLKWGFNEMFSNDTPAPKEMIIEPLPQNDFIEACGDLCAKSGAYGSILISPEDHYYCSCAFYPEQAGPPDEF